MYFIKVSQKVISVENTAEAFIYQLRIIKSVPSRISFSVFLPPAIEVAEGIVFSRVCPSICQSFYPQGEGSNVTITHDAFDFTV